MIFGGLLVVLCLSFVNYIIFIDDYSFISFVSLLKDHINVLTFFFGSLKKYNITDSLDLRHFHKNKDAKE